MFRGWWDEALEEAFEDRESLRYNVSLAGAGAEDGGKCVQDSGVKVGFYDRGEDV